MEINMPRTNINITDNSNQYHYVIEYDKVDTLLSSGMKYIYSPQYQEIIFIDENSKYIKNCNNWNIISDENIVDINKPSSYEYGLLRLYFPSHSVDIYDPGVDYALSVYTWIKGKRIVLGSYIFNRIDALACDSVKNIDNKKYYEYIEFPIIDANSLIFSDDWEDWRRNVCQENSDQDLINSVGSIIYTSLHIVEKNESGYIKKDGYTGGQNSINIAKENDFLTLNIQPNTNKSLLRAERPAIECALSFNDYYEGDLNEYLIETYGGDSDTEYNIQYELVIGNESILYTICSSPILPSIKTYNFTKDIINNATINNGQVWKEGIDIVVSANILKDNVPILYLLSNKIPLTLDIYRYFTQNDFNDEYNYKVNNVNLNEVDMNFLNINVVNKIENTIIQVDRPNDTKANMIQPVFFRTTESSNIIVHPMVTEIICINLDQYKSKVKVFNIQIEGIKFIEYGRNNSGVLFKVVGNKLPKKINSGIYYILNQDSELVTTGKYSYVQ